MQQSQIADSETDDFVARVNSTVSGRSSEHYVDFLREHQHFSDTWWLITHQWHSTTFEGSLRRTTAQIADDVFKDPTIKCLLDGDPSLRAQVADILGEMAHSFSITTAKIIFFLVMKAMKSSYAQVYFENRLSGAHEPYCSMSLSGALNSLAGSTRVVFVPNHRSYADFLAQVFVSFACNLPLSTLATGRNLLSVRALVYLIRCSGAFFIRRNFYSDPVYRRVYRAYVRSQVLGGERPLTFYLEGTRARTGKTCRPRLGTLKLLVEMVLRGQVADVALVPIAHSYDRVLEEEKYAQEEVCQDAGKPTENTRNLWRGIRQIAQQDNGAAYMRFGAPISVRAMLVAHSGGAQWLQRHAHDDQTHDLVFTDHESRFVVDLARRVLLAQIDRSLVSAFHLTAVVITAHHRRGLRPLHFDRAELLADVCSLALLIPSHLSVTVNGLTMQEDLQRTVRAHANLVTFDPDRCDVLTVAADQPLVMAQLQMYANQALQLLVDHAVALYVDRDRTHFRTVRLLLAHEFILVESECDQLFDQTNTTDLTVTAVDSLRTQVLYSLHAYRLVATSVHRHCVTTADWTPPLSQRWCHRRLQAELSLATDLIHNALASLVQCGALLAAAVVTSDECKPDHDSVRVDSDALTQFISTLTTAIGVKHTHLLARTQ